MLTALLVGCSSGGGLPHATTRDFPDLEAVAEYARAVATSSGDAHPKGVSIVKTTQAAVFHDVVLSDPARQREIYDIRIDGDFKECSTCSHPSSFSGFGPKRWIGFTWDPQQHAVMDFGYGSADHLEELGKVYAIDLD